MILLIILGFKGQLILSFFIVVFHESVHYLAAVYFGFSGFDVEILPIGAVLKLRELDEASPKEDIIISLSAPIMNLALAMVIYIIYRNFRYDILYPLFSGNLALGAFNLIPAFPLDGGRVLRSILSQKTIFRRANEITIRVSFFSGSILILYSFISFISGHMNLTVLIIGGFIIVSAYKERERVAYIIMGDIIRKRSKFINRGFIENKSISVYYKNDLITILSIVDKNKYNIFTVLDDEMKVMDLIYEDEIIEALKYHGNMTIEDFVRIREENI